jgi:hypothetical protein
MNFLFPWWILSLTKLNTSFIVWKKLVWFLKSVFYVTCTLGWKSPISCPVNSKKYSQYKPWHSISEANVNKQSKFITDLFRFIWCSDNLFESELNLGKMCGQCEKWWVELFLFFFQFLQLDIFRVTTENNTKLHEKLSHHMQQLYFPMHE